MTKGEANLGRPVEGLVSCRTAGELPTVGQCGQVAEFLRQAQVASEQTGDAVRAHVLAVARRICLACIQCRAEVEWHRRAHEEADQRAHELRQQFHAVLDLISGRETPETPEKREEPPTAPPAEMSLPERGAPKPVERLNLWQRIRSLLGRRPGSRSSEREVPVISAEVMALSPAKEERRSSPSLAVYCLGPFRVYQNDQLITDWDSLKARSILKYLVAHRRTPIIKDILMDLFWPDADPEAARRNLHQAIYSLRQTLRQGLADFQHIQFEDGCYLLNPEIDIWLDFAELEKHVQAGRRLEAAGQLAEAVAEYSIAESLYQGDFLEEDLYEDWPQSYRQYLWNVYLAITHWLAQHYLEQGEYAATIALSQRILTRDNCQEKAHQKMIRCYLAQGQRHLAVRQYQLCVQVLKAKLDLSPSQETQALYKQIAGG